MGVFDDLPDLVAELITDLHDTEGLGFQVNYSSAGEGAYNTANGTAAAPTSTETVIGFEDGFTTTELASPLVVTGDRVIAIPAALMTVTPAPADTLDVGGDPYAVVQVLTSQPGAAAVLHRLHCRRA